MPKHSTSSKQKSKYNGGWSEWVWSEEHSRYYCYRIKRNGETEYEWGGAAAAAQPQDEATPRQAAEVDDITAGVAQMSTSPSDDYSYGTASSTGGGDEGPYSYPRTGSKKPGRSRKGKEVYYEPGDAEPDIPEPAPPLDPFYGAGRTDTPQTYPATPTGTEQELPPSESTRETLYQEPAGYASGYGSSGGYTNDAYAAAGDDYDSRLRQAMADSHDQMYGRRQSQGESSNDSAYVSMAHSEEDEGASTPKASERQIDIRGTNGYAETLDPRYVIEPSNKFSPGSIFKVLWPEPLGNDVRGTPTISDKQTIRDGWGGSVHVGFRRFIVVANDEGHCQCVPILTYQGKACKKKGVKANKHGIIVAQNQKPRMLSGEPDLGFEPIRARLIVEGEKLAKESRVNYSKIVTVEHNVKVFFIGRIINEDAEALDDAVNYCWEQKFHKKHRRH